SSGGNSNFLVFNRGGSTLWETNTVHAGAFEVVQQTDANVVMYQSGGGVPWASNQVSGPYASLCDDPYYGRLTAMKTWMRPHKDLWGADYSSFQTTLGQCGGACALDANCHAFTYYGGWCYLKNGQPSESNLSNAFSGRKLIGNYAWY
ncbi:MAG: PAN/Apple domain-containing protein, partial [Polyangiaceae bacterium]